MKAFSTVLTLAVLAVFGLGRALAAAPAPGEKNAQGLTAQITSESDKYTYTLDPATSGEAFKELLKKAKTPRNNVRLPKPPEVDLVLLITNTTDKPVTINVGGDDSRIELKLEGPGAVTVENLVPMTMEFRQGKAVTIEPGKSHAIKITSLAFGLRGISQYAYWTEAGAYTMTATLVYPVDDKQTAVTSGAAKITVEEPKKK